MAPEEFEAVKAHVQHGLDILVETPNFHPDVIEGIAQHHERMNGSGYPRGLVGEEIGVIGRMAGIVDYQGKLASDGKTAEAEGKATASKLKLVRSGGPPRGQALNQVTPAHLAGLEIPQQEIDGGRFHEGTLGRLRGS